MDSVEKRSGSKGLKILLFVLVFVIVSLVVGLVIVIVNKNNQIVEEGMNGEVEKIVAEYQEKIDNADGSEERIILYKERFEILVNIMEESGDDLCMQIMSDAGVVIDSSDSAMSKDIFEEIPNECLIKTEPGVMVRVEEPEENDE